MSNAMKNYEVTIERIAYTSLTVQAPDQEAAEALAWRMYSGNADDCASNQIFNIEELSK